MNNNVIEETRAFKFGDTAYLTREEAQKAAIIELFRSNEIQQREVWTPNAAAELILDQRDAILAILTGEKPRRARSDKGKPHAKPKKRRPENVLDQIRSPEKLFAPITSAQ